MHFVFPMKGSRHFCQNTDRCLRRVCQIFFFYNYNNNPKWIDFKLIFTTDSKSMWMEFVDSRLLFTHDKFPFCPTVWLQSNLHQWQLHWKSKFICICGKVSLKLIKNIVNCDSLALDNSWLAGEYFFPSKLMRYQTGPILYTLFVANNKHDKLIDIDFEQKWLEWNSWYVI